MCIIMTPLPYTINTNFQFPCYANVAENSIKFAGNISANFNLSEWKSRGMLMKLNFTPKHVNKKWGVSYKRNKLDLIYHL